MLIFYYPLIYLELHNFIAHKICFLLFWRVMSLWVISEYVLAGDVSKCAHFHLVLLVQGWIQDFNFGGGVLKKIAPEQREARKFLRYFGWKITILRQKIIFFPILEGARAGCAPSPWTRPCLVRMTLKIWNTWCNQ